MDNYKHSAHSKHSLMVHLIFVTKYRKKLFIDDIRNNDIKQFMYEGCLKYGYEIVQMESDKDHIHLLVAYKPKESVSNIAKKLKQFSTQKMWKYHYKYLKHEYWQKETLWSDGYFACSIGQISKATIEKYIANQG